MEKAPSKSVVTYGLKNIRPNHREMARRLALGYTQSEVCRMMGVDPGRMSVICNSPLFKRELKKFEDERDRGVINIHKELDELSPVALGIIERTMYTAKSETTRLRAAETIMDRAGHGAIGKSMVQFGGYINVNTSSMSDTELRDLAIKRIKKIDKQIESRQKMIAESDAMEVDFVEISEEDETIEVKSNTPTEGNEPKNECSEDEQEAPKPISIANIG